VRCTCFRPFLVTYFYNAGLPILLGLILALVVCGAIGCINGLVTVKLHIPSFITTLGMTFALEGIILIGSNGAPANPVGTGNLVSWLAARPGPRPSGHWPSSECCT